jgi:acyl dehydratase
MVGWYFEQFRVGESFETGSRVVSRDDIAAFAQLTSDGNPLHTDTNFAKSTGYRDIIAHGPLILSLAIGLMAGLEIVTGTTIALLQVSAQFLKPVFPGDEIRAVMTIEDKRESRKADRGVLNRRVDVLNQADEIVITTSLISLMRRRPVAERREPGILTGSS